MNFNVIELKNKRKISLCQKSEFARYAKVKLQYINVLIQNAINWFVWIVLMII
jgi:hypothetical protein